MNCPFCATGQAGLTRNLSAAEIFGQVLAGAQSLARNEIAGGPGRVSNIVFMGMGEPLANYKAVMGAIHRIVDPSPSGLGMSARGVTVSTVGLGPADQTIGHRGVASHPGRVPTCPRQRIARHLGTDQYPVVGRGSARCCLGVRRCHEASSQY